MKRERSFNILSVGLLMGLAGSLLLNLYQLNERNSRATVAPLSYAWVRNTRPKQLLPSPRQFPRKDSLIHYPPP